MNVKCPICKSTDVIVDLQIPSKFSKDPDVKGFSFKCNNCSANFEQNIEGTCLKGVCVSCIRHENKLKIFDLYDNDLDRDLLTFEILNIDKNKYGIMTEKSFEDFINLK